MHATTCLSDCLCAANICVGENMCTEWACLRLCLRERTAVVVHKVKV